MQATIGPIQSSVMDMTEVLLKQMAKGYIAPEDDCQSFCYKKVPLKKQSIILLIILEEPQAT